MKNLRNAIAAIIMVAVLSVTTTFAGDGILVAGYSDDTTTSGCTANADTKADVNSGILVAGFTGILVAGFTGILVAGYSDNDETQTNCGILVAG